MDYFNYSKEKKVIPMPKCRRRKVMKFKSCFIDHNRISTMPIISIASKEYMKRTNKQEGQKRLLKKI